MQKSSINPMPQFFDRYINIVEEDNLLIALDKSLKELENIAFATLSQVGHKTYQEGKWTILDIIQHIIDNERIQSYRAMRIARNDNTPLPGYDENLFAQNAHANNRTLQELMDELYLLRKSTIQLFKSFDKSVFNNVGICFNQTVTVTSLGFVIVGHQQHHFNVINEKYIPLITDSSTV